MNQSWYDNLNQMNTTWQKPNNVKPRRETKQWDEITKKRKWKKDHIYVKTTYLDKVYENWCKGIGSRQQKSGLKTTISGGWEREKREVEERLRETARLEEWLKKNGNFIPLFTVKEKKSISLD